MQSIRHVFLMIQYRAAGSGNGVCHIHKVTLHWVRLVLELLTTFSGSIQFRHFPGQSGHLSLAIPRWAGVISTYDGFGHRWGWNSEFCVAVYPVTSTAGILTVKGAGNLTDMGRMLAELGLTLTSLKHSQGNQLPHYRLHLLCIHLFCFQSQKYEELWLQ